MSSFGVAPGVKLIKEIYKREQYWALQDRLETAAAAAGVPRVWFDDVWATRPRAAMNEDSTEWRGIRGRPRISSSGC